MIQDIAPHIYYNQYKPVPPDANSIVLYYKDKEVLLAQKDGEIRFPRFKELEALNPDLYENYTYLFSIDQERFYLMNHISRPAVSEYTMENTMIFRTAAPAWLAFAGITGFQLYGWYRTRKFCGRCGKPMSHSDKERMMYCAECKTMEYPKISPAVIVAVTHGNRILMSKYANRTYTRYALLAGFTEIGETLEETVKREVMEEVGVRVKNLRYYKTQPWSFTDTLLIGFYAELDGDDETITLDREELALAEWIEREDIPEDSNHVSLTSEMIRRFKNHMA